MATETTKKLRNWAHFLATVILLYRTGQYFDMHNYLYDPQNPFEWIFEMSLYVVVGGFAIGCLFGGAYEIPYKLVLFKERADAMDIINSGYGGQVGLLLYFIFPFVPLTIQYILLGVIGVGILADLYFTIKRKPK